MRQFQTQFSSPRLLAQLMQHPEATACWHPSEYAPILRDLLALPVPPPPDAKPPAAPAPATPTIEQLFANPTPSLDLLVQLKDFARDHIHKPGEAIPKEVAAVVYFAAILAARCRLGERITGLDDAAVRNGGEWALEQPWLHGEIKAILRDGIAAVRSGER